MARPARPMRIDGDVAYVPLTKGYEAVIDASDVCLVAGYRWQVIVSPHTAYAVRTDYSGDKSQQIRMHRAIADGNSGLDVDHRDGNGLNNRRANLRTATRSQNTCNMRTSSANTSGVKGVNWSKDRSKWVARIRLDGRTLWSQRFDCLAEAAAARAEKLVAIHGDFARAV